jgi:hypothetical protein
VHRPQGVGVGAAWLPADIEQPAAAMYTALTMGQKVSDGSSTCLLTQAVLLILGRCCLLDGPA